MLLIKNKVDKSLISGAGLGLFTLQDIQGNTYEVENITHFCNAHNLDKGAISKVGRGISKSHKGFTLLKITNNGIQEAISVQEPSLQERVVELEFIVKWLQEQLSPLRDIYDSQIKRQIKNTQFGTENKKELMEKPNDWANYSMDERCEWLESNT